LDFLGKDGFGRIGIKIKKASYMDGMPKVWGKIYFDHLTLKTTQIIQFQCLNFFSNFGTKVYFFIF